MMRLMPLALALDRGKARVVAAVLQRHLAR
jgi:hypothetical protein